jgi:hypothetical protein
MYTYVPHAVLGFYLLLCDQLQNVPRAVLGFYLLLCDTLHEVLIGAFFSHISRTSRQLTIIYWLLWKRAQENRNDSCVPLKDGYCSAEPLLLPLKLGRLVIKTRLTCSVIWND